MLYDFHRLQNGRKPGTTHATYLIAGYMKKELDVAQDPKDGDDAYMQSSPVLHSEELIEDLPILAIKLVKEEDLESTTPKAAKFEALADLWTRIAVRLRSDNVNTHL